MELWSILLLDFPNYVMIIDDFFIFASASKKWFLVCNMQVDNVTTKSALSFTRLI